MVHGLHSLVNATCECDVDGRYSSGYFNGFNFTRFEFDLIQLTQPLSFSELAHAKNDFYVFGGESEKCNIEMMN